jgi:regulatory protein
VPARTPRVQGPSNRTAYDDALHLLGRRELSEAQIRERLARKGHEPSDIDAAVVRLVREGTIDDSRVAAVIARSETIKRRGRHRVYRRVEQAGIAASTARRAVDEIFEALEADALLEAAIERRVRGRLVRLSNAADFRRVYRYLVNQGFEPDRILAALDRRR